LTSIADNLDAVRQALAARAALETGLPAAQLEGEAAKAAAQFRQFAEVVRQGRFLQLAIDPAQPDRQPRPRMDHRLQKIAIGPVAVFGASNFPISYSVAGGDTASALAAGATVIVKAHNAHPGASEIQARAIRKAVQDNGLPEGVFSMIRGGGNAIGEALVDHPLIKAVTFTGSEQGGMALYLGRSKPRADSGVYRDDQRQPHVHPPRMHWLNVAARSVMDLSNACWSMSGKPASNLPC